MDIFSHGLWAGAATQGANLSPRLQTKIRRHLNIPLAMFWGVFPDLFAFTIPFFWVLFQIMIGGASFQEFRPPHEPSSQINNLPVFHLASSLYRVSHSIVIFFLVFAILYIILKRPVWEMLGALLHILSDIPTHAVTFYPTPFLWPISDYTFTHGFSWGVSWFITLNYSLLLLTYTLLYRKKKLSQGSIATIRN